MGEVKTEDQQEFEFPKKGDRLVDSAFDWWGHAALQWDDHNEAAFATGYKTAADLLAEKVLGEGRDVDRLVFPIMFLYRHSLELSLKLINRLGKQLLDQPQDLPGGHVLPNLWGRARRILEEVYQPGEDQTLKHLERIIADIYKIDPNSEAFRYPTDQDGRTTLESLRHIDLMRVKQVMNRATFFLDCVTGGLEQFLSFRREAERNY